MARYFNAGLSGLFPINRLIPEIEVGTGQLNQPFVYFWDSDDADADPIDELHLDEGDDVTLWLTLRHQPGTQGLPNTVRVSLRTLFAGITLTGGIGQLVGIRLPDFTTSNWNVRDTNNDFGVSTFQDANADHVIDAIAATATDLGLDVLPVTVLDDEAALVVEDAPSIMIEGETAEFTVKLAGSPLDNVVVRVGSGDETALAVAGGRNLLFTTNTFNKAQTVTLYAPPDPDSVGEVVAITVTATGGGYDDVTDNVFGVEVWDLTPAPAITRTVTPTSINEGGDDMVVSFHLNRQPAADVTVTGTTNHESLEFTGGNSVTFTREAEGWDDGISLPSGANNPRGLDIHPNGNLIMIDNGTDDIYSYDYDSDTWAFVVSNHPNGLDPQGVARRANGDLAVADNGTNAVYIYSGGSWNSFGIALPAGATYPVGIIANDDDNLVVLDRTTDSIYVLDVDAGTWSSGLDIHSGAVNPSGLDRRANGNYLVVDEGTDAIFEYDGSDWTELLETPPGAGRARGLAIDHSTDDILIADDQTRRIYRYRAPVWSAPRDLTLTAPEDNDPHNHDVDVTLTATGGGFDGVTSEFEVEVIDPDVASMVFTGFPMTINEGSTGTYMVRPSHQPTGDVTVTTSSNDTTALTVTTGATLSFGVTDWKTNKSVTLTGVEDPDIGDETVTVRTMVSGGGFDSADRMDTVTVADDEVPGIRAEHSSLMVAETGSVMIGISLTAQPLATVTVSASIADTDIATVSPAARTYTTSNWNTNQSFTVSGVEDDDLATETVQLTFSAANGGYDNIDRTIPVTVIDQDTAGLVIVAVDGTTVGEGDSIEFTIKLSNEPSDDVEVTVSTDNDDVVLVGTDEDDIDEEEVTLTFTSENWDTNQSVYVEGVQDSDADDETGFIDFSADGGGFNLDIVQQVHVTDDDKSLLVSKTIPTLSEGATNTYQVRLNAVPTGNVTVTSMSGDTDALVVTPTTRTFTPTNWNTPQTFTATAQQDANAIDETIEVTFTASGADFNNLSVETDTEVTDDETVGFQFSGSQSIVEGAGGLLRLRLTSEPSANVSVTATSLSLIHISEPTRPY